MQTGKIKKLINVKGYGFIADENDKEIFFHRSNLEDVEFEHLREGQEIQLI